MRSIKSLSASSAFRNSILFYLFRGIQIFFPLLTTPYLSRVLSKEDFGKIFVAQAISIIVSVVVEFGFGYTATRRVSQNRDNFEALKNITSEVGSSKIFISLVSIIPTILYIQLVSLDLSYAIPVILASIAMGWIPTWYFQGTGKIWFLLIPEFVLRLSNLFLMFIFVNNTSDGIIYLYIIAATQMISCTFQLSIVIRKYRPSFLSLADVFPILRSNMSIFVFRASSIIYTSGSTALLATVVGPTSLALYGGSDRLFRVSLNVISPVSEVLFPVISNAEGGDSKRLRKIRAVSSCVTFGIAMIVGILIFSFSTSIVEFFLGNNYRESANILKILALDLPLIGIGTIVFVYYLLPKGIDSAIAIATVLAGCWTMLSVLFLVPQFGLEWMAWTIVISEIIVITYGLYEVMRFRRRIS